MVEFNFEIPAGSHVDKMRELTSSEMRKDILARISQAYAREYTPFTVEEVNDYSLQNNLSSLPPEVRGHIGMAATGEGWSIEEYGKRITGGGC